MKGWVGGQSNVYVHKVNDLFLFTSIVYKGWVGGQKSPKFCLRSYWMPPKCMKYEKLSNSVINDLCFLKSSLLHIYFAVHDYEILCNLPSNMSILSIWKFIRNTRVKWLTNVFGRKISIVKIGGRISAKSFCFWNYSDPKVAFKRYLTAWWYIISCLGYL